MKADGSTHTANVPISWRDIKWNQFVELTGSEFDNEVAKLAAFCNIPLEVLLMNPLLLNACIEACKFIWTSNVDEYIEICPAKYKVDVEENDWGKLETAKAALKESGTNYWGAGETIVRTYCNEEIGDRSCIEVVGIVAFFLAKLEHSLPNSQDLMMK